MYGDMSSVRADAAALSDRASAMRSQASRLIAQAEVMKWNSAAGNAFRHQIVGSANDMRSAAGQLSDASEALFRHPTAVDGVKTEIREAEALVGEAIGEAQHIARHAVEVVKNVAESALTELMTVLSSVVSAAQSMVRVSVFTLFGHEISQSTVHRARRISSAIPERPVSGSIDWIQIKSVFDSIR